MYKAQMKLQKVVCLLTLCAGAIVFIYSLGIMTDLFDLLYNQIPDPEELDKAKVTGARIYYDMQPFNKQLLRCGIVLILAACTLMITNTQKRRRYYLGNYVTTALNCGLDIAAMVWIHIQVAAYKTRYLTTVDFTQLRRRTERLGIYTESTFWFDIHFAVCAILLLSALLLIMNLVFKLLLMHGESKLLSEGKAVSL